MPSVLVADDNALSLRFLLDALAQLGIAADGAADGASAFDQAIGKSYDLLLLDCRMPKLSGPEVLRRLRDAGIATPAIATSAELTPTQRDRLRAEGFVQSLEKPLSLKTLETTLRRYIPLPPVQVPAVSHMDTPSLTGTAVAILDDTAALSGVGNDAAILRALRKMLAAELTGLPAELDQLHQTDNRHGLRERLHRLHASAGFCGASALADVCTGLRDATDNSSAPLTNALRHLQQTITTTLVALNAATS